MNWISNNEGKIVTAIVVATSGSVAAGASWLVRTIFTNHKRLGLLEQRTELTHADLTRRLDEMQARTTAAQKEIMSAIREITK